MGKFSSQAASIAADAIRSGKSADAAVAKFRNDNNLDNNDNPKVVSFYRVEYRNRSDSGTHWGRVYKTEKGALKNRYNNRFIRAVKFASA